MKLTEIIANRPKVREKYVLTKLIRTKQQKSGQYFILPQEAEVKITSVGLFSSKLEIELVSVLPTPAIEFDFTEHIGDRFEVAIDKFRQASFKGTRREYNAAWINNLHNPS
jgi:hypothetical protein